MKRPDLQGLRGVAVALVVAFHLKPNRLELGFVGVDMFFVLSGYFMSVILNKTPLSFHRIPYSITIIIDFYRRRFKRIVPLFYVIVIVIYSVCWFMLILPDKEEILNDITWTMSFTSNIQMIHDEAGYWDQVSQYRFFVHAWSLGVEIQFYLMAPVLLGWEFQHRIIKIGLLVVIAIVSILFQLFVPTKIGYLLIWGRIWQFLCGALANEIDTYIRERTHAEVYIEAARAEDMETGYKGKAIVADTVKADIWPARLSNIIIGLVVVLVIFNPSLVSQSSMRVMGTLGAALVIYISVPSIDSLLCNRSLVYLGDISYTLYLVHWPVIVGAKYYLNVADLGLLQILVVIIIIMLLTVAIHRTVENYLCRTSFVISIVVSLLCCLFVATTFQAYTVYTYEGNFLSKGSSNNTIDLRAVVAWNLRESRKFRLDAPCEPDPETVEWTKFVGEPKLRCKFTGNGTAKIMIMGNSIAYRATAVIHKILRGRYSILRMYTKSGTTGGPALSYRNASYTAAARIVVDKMRPDILMTMHIQTDPEYVSPFVDPHTDPLFLEFQENLDYYKVRTKHMVIDLPYYNDTRRAAYEVAKRLQQSLPLDDLKVTREEDVQQAKYHRERLLRLKCDNCIINPIHESFFEDDIYWLYNRSSLRAYTGDGYHLTSEGLNLVRPTYERILEGLLKQFE